MDPRIKTPATALAQQFQLASRICDLMHRDFEALGRAKGKNDRAAQSLTRLNGELTELLEVIDGSDSAPTTQAVHAVAEAARSLELLLKGDVGAPVK